MDAAYISALAALSGSAIGALSTFATTWLTQNANHRLDRMEKDRARREAVYGAFIDEASALFADAIIHEMHDTAQLVKLYSLVSRMRLFSSPEIVKKAEDVVRQVVDCYNAPNRQVQDLRSTKFGDLDPLKQFSETCREELSSI